MWNAGPADVSKRIQTFFFVTTTFFELCTFFFAFKSSCLISLA